MSNKLAAGAAAIVLHVKCVRGAFMELLPEARELAELMVSIGSGAGRRVTALVTAMEQPLGRAIGNILEVREAIDTLQGGGPADFQELTQEVATEMLLLGDPELHKEHEAAGEESGRSSARSRVLEAIDSGAAFDKFVQFVAAQGGDAAAVANPDLLDTASAVLELKSKRGGIVSRLDARAVGLAVAALGGGRQRKGDAIDHRVGVVLASKVGEQVLAGDPLCTVHAADADAARLAADRILDAYSFRDLPQEAAAEPEERVDAERAAAPESQERPIILDRITS